MNPPRLVFSILPIVLLGSACPPRPPENPDGGAATSPADASSPDGSRPDASVSADAGPAGTGTPRGAEATPDQCGNGEDDDHNGYADCDDFWCRDTVTVSSCNALENTAQACQDGVDNPESPGNPNQARTDGLIDCADPDCGKNPALGVCPVLAFETGAACDNSVDDDGDGRVDCADPDCLHAGASACGLGERRRVLFDDAHRERAGSADWVVDTTGPHPWPSVPQVETDWAGALSSFGMALAAGRFTVETLPASGWLRLGTDDPQDLSHYAVLVLPEPSAPLAPDEIDAVVAFVQGGGGLLVVADHFDSDRDGNGWDSVQVFNDVLTRAGGGTLDANPFGFSVSLLSYQASGAIEAINQGATSTIPADVVAHPVLDGPHGRVQRVGMHKGGLFTLHAGASAAVTVLVHALPLGTAGYELGSPYVVAAEVGQGRVVAVGDSAIMNDGTDSHGLRDSRFDSWNEDNEDNAALLLNAVEWLAPAGT